MKIYPQSLVSCHAIGSYYKNIITFFKWLDYLKKITHFKALGEITSLSVIHMLWGIRVAVISAQLGCQLWELERFA